MIEAGKYCPDILMQTQAVRAAIQAVEGSILKRHLEHCVHRAFTSSRKKEIQAKIRELLRLYGKKS